MSSVVRPLYPVGTGCDRPARPPHLLVAGLVAGTVMLVGWTGGDARAQPRCRGTKQYYAGKCRYPDDIRRLKQSLARSRAQADAARKKKEQEQQEAEQRKARDTQACERAREADSVAAWKVYQAAHPEGACKDEAQQRIEELAALASAGPAEPAEDEDPRDGADPATAAASESATDDAPPPDAADGGGISPLVWVGFGISAAGFVTFGVAGGIALAKRSDLDDICPGQTCPPAEEAELDSGTAAAHAATVGLVIGGAGAALGIVGLLLSGSDDPDGEDVDMAYSVRPLIGPGTLGVTGTF